VTVGHTRLVAPGDGSLNEKYEPWQLATACHRCTVVFKFFWGGTYMGLWENLGGGPLFLCIIAFLCYNFSKSFEGVHEVPPPSSPPLPLCASMVCHNICTTSVYL
jgi:hypothetical protein